MSGDNAKINCPIFQKQEPAIKHITAAINGAREGSEKAELARQLQEEVGVLISCPDYDEDSMDCSNCRLIANVRKKVAYLLRKAEKLT